ncbi:MAG: membrane protein insertase YidC [bacterium]|nr:membrane protein insertase YidC [bacterium]
MDKNAVLAVVLSFLVLYGYQSYFVPSAEEPNQIAYKQGETISSVGETAVGKSLSLEKTATASSVSSPAATAAPKKQNVGTIEAKKITFSGKKTHVTFSSLGGGGVESIALNDYRAELAKESLPLDRVNISKGDPLPLSLSFSAATLNIGPDTVFDVTDSTESSPRFSWTSPEGVTIEKSYILDPGSYQMKMAVSIKNNSAEALEGDLAINLYEQATVEGDMRTFIGISTKIGDEIEKKTFEDIKDEEFSIEGKPLWFAQEEQYFLSAIIPEESSVKKIVAKKLHGDLIASALVYPDISLSPGEGATFSSTFYSGPKDIYLLKDVGAGLEGTINLGWFHAIAEPLLRFLKLIYSFTGNYGYAIILLTLMIKIVFFPLANKSYKSMKEMQKLQPIMAELREKYKNDKERMSREVMELYKKNRVNPLSGCLPMIVQIPVFIALYNVLMNAIELRHAPFHFWITDMSIKDPYYITPLIMGATMFLQQKLSPSAPDPTQQKVMMMMPVIFTFMFMNLPSGLVLYWIVNNVLSITQQYYIIKKT